jgi:hypothetical protein
MRVWCCSTADILDREATVKHQWILVLGLGLVLAAMAQLAPAQADCIDDCARVYGGPVTENAQLCMKLQCNKPTVMYGAIAYGAQSTASGWSYGFNNAAGANNLALSNCRERGNDCRIVLSFSNSCAALAAIESKGVFAVGQGASRDQAQSRAMSACASHYGSGCEIEVWDCSGP